MVVMSNNPVCSKCGLRYVGQPIKDYKESICWICFLKSKRYYKSAMKEIKNGWFDWWTDLLKYKVGWSFAKKVMLTGLFISILKCKSLNKTSKTEITQNDLWSDWQLQTAKDYYKEYE